MDVNDKIRPFLIAKILMERTDEDHTLTTNQICQILKDEYGIDTFRTTVKSDVAVLQSVGIGVREIRSTQNRYCYFDKQFELAELKLLIDAVKTARFIPEAQSDQLESKLTSLTGPFRKNEIKRNVVIENRYKSENEHILLTVDIINKAINLHKKIRLQLFGYDEKKNVVLLNDSKEYTLSPYSLIWKGDHYHVIGVSEKVHSLCSYRVDRIYPVPVILQEDAIVYNENEVTRYIQTLFQTDGASRIEVKLIAENQLMDEMIERFGLDVETEPLDTDRFLLTTTVSAGDQFYNWIFGLHGRVRIFAPAQMREEYAKLIQKASEAHITIEEVLGCSHTVRVLNKAGIYTMDELSQYSREELLQIRGVGKVIAEDLMKAIEKWNAN